MEYDRLRLATGVLYARIDKRVDQMIQEGLEDEVRKLSREDVQKLDNTIGYQEWLPFFAGNRSKEEVIRLIKRNSRRYASVNLPGFATKQTANGLHLKQVSYGCPRY